MAEPKTIASRDDLSFTRRDAAGRLVNWYVTHDANDAWGEKYVIGQSYLDEIAELAMHSELEAYHAVRCGSRSPAAEISSAATTPRSATSAGAKSMASPRRLRAR